MMIYCTLTVVWGGKKLQVSILCKILITTSDSKCGSIPNAFQQHPYGWNFSGRTKHQNDVIILLFLTLYFGNLEVSNIKKFYILWKYMYMQIHRWPHIDHTSHGDPLWGQYFFLIFKKCGSFFTWFLAMNHLFQLKSIKKMIGVLPKSISKKRNVIIVL